MKISFATEHHCWGFGLTVWPTHDYETWVSPWSFILRFGPFVMTCESKKWDDA